MKKLLKILRYTLIVVVIVLLSGLAYLYYNFNYYSLEDQYEVNDANLAYFNQSYEEGRNSFRQKATELAQKYQGAKLFNINVDSKVDTDLTMDLFFIPSKIITDKILIISSGVHGVEGYVGNAVQLFFMENYLNDDLLNKTSILLIHSVNPYGFKYTRRVSENNIDINRNCDVDKKLYSTVNEGYPKVYELINPKDKVDYGSLGNKFFFAKAMAEIAKASMPVLRQAVLQGQYNFPKGLYYGGNDFEPQIKKLKPIIDSICDPYEIILAIDLHTGYGKRGKLHLFPNPVEEPVQKRIETIFEGFKIDWGDSDEFYVITGDFVGFIGKINHDKQIIPILFEYGTMNSQTTMGSLKSIHTMILENEGEQHGFETNTDKEKVKKDLLEMYYPESKAWRSHIIDETKKVLDKSLKLFTEQENIL